MKEKISVGSTNTPSAVKHTSHDPKAKPRPLNGHPQFSDSAPIMPLAEASVILTMQENNL